MSDALDIFAAARACPDALALRIDAEHLTWAQLAERSAAVLSRLPQLEPRDGARVALLAENSVATVAAIYALIARAVPFVPLHPRLAPAQADALVRDARCALDLRDGALGSLAAPAPGTPLPGFAAPPPAAPLAVLYTSGSSGDPKGAVLSRRAFLASAAASARALSHTSRDRWLLCLPVCHVGGLSVLTRSLAARTPVLLHSRFDPDRVLDAITRDGATVLSVVPTMLHTLLARDRGNALARLRVVLIGGAGCPRSLLEECAARSVSAHTTYGLTEACSQATVQRAPARPPRDDSGAPLDSVEVRTVRDDGSLCGPDEEGAIQLRGPTLFDGYLHHPARDPEAWFDTGDLGALSAERALTVFSRRTDLVITGGENVYPAQVERALEAQPGVARALVFGEPDARWGQRVCAVLVPRGPAPNLAQLDRALRGALASFALPRRYAFATDEEIPLLPSGKVHRRALLERFRARLADVT